MVNGANSSKYAVKSITSIQKKTQFYFVKSVAIYSLMFFDRAHIILKFSIRKQPTEVFCKKRCCSGLQFIKKEAQVFSCEIYEISKNTFFKELRWVTASIHLKLFRSKYDLFVRLWGFHGNLRPIFAQKKENFHRCHYP